MTATVSLNVIKGPLEGERFEFRDRTLCIVGRSRDCNVKLPDDPHHRTISRYHCMLDISPPHLRVRDFGSRNGTYVNGINIGQRHRGQRPEDADHEGFAVFDLGEGDHITLGNTVFEVEKTVLREVERGAERPQGRTILESPTMDRLRDVVRLIQEQAKKGGDELVSFGGYTVLRALGEGGMGKVYLTRDDNSGEEFALKTLLPEVAVNPDARELFLREVLNTAALRHPKIVELHDAGSYDDVFFCTLEYCNGGSVDALIREHGGRLELDHALRIMLDLLEGLDFAHNADIAVADAADGAVKHGRGVVHRDLKPANIYLSDSGSGEVAKVGDFGLSKSFDLAGLSGQTTTGASGGTPLYVPRQQVLDYKYARPDVDLWAAAATFYKMVTGSAPRNFERGVDPWLTVLQGVPVPMLERNPDVPERLAAVIDTALIDNPELHFQTAADLRRAIEEAL